MLDISVVVVILGCIFQVYVFYRMKRLIKHKEGTPSASHNNERAESATKSCEGCRNWKRDKRWGLNCTDCIRNIDRIVDNFNVAQSPVS